MRSDGGADVRRRHDQAAFPGRADVVGIGGGIVGVTLRIVRDRRRASTPGAAEPRGIVGLIGAVLFERNDEWRTQHRYMQVEAFARIDAVEADPILSLETQAA